MLVPGERLIGLAQTQQGIGSDVPCSGQRLGEPQTRMFGGLRGDDSSGAVNQRTCFRSGLFPPSGKEKRRR